MNKRKWLLLICAVLVVVVAIPVGWAYYEYVGKYRLLINGDGTINQNAFGVLNSEIYRDPRYGYGTTPENPFVIDSIERLNNLIRLNNTGLLLKSKLVGENYNAPQYYFVFDFTNEELAQVLDLDGRTISSVGNNDYPFIDELSGLLYAYCYNENSFIYISGCIKPSVVEVVDGVVIIDGNETQVTGTVQSGEYIRLPKMYIDYANSDPDKISAGSEVYIPLSNLIPIHNVIANATVVVPDSQVDVGFFNCIARETLNTDEVTGYVHDVIFYNLNITCTETLWGTVRNELESLWNQIFGNHNFEDSYNYRQGENEYYERHIGLFAGHIDGAASRITVAGDCNIVINTKGVNYYSAYTTVGYVHNTAIIGGVPFSELIGTGSGIGIGTGCLFADSIKAIAEGDENNSEYKIEIPDGDDNPDNDKTGYRLKRIPPSGMWSGVSDDLCFTYGTFNFILSSEDDTLNDIWSGRGAINLLNAEGFSVTESVLYCNDEYRYSGAAQTGGSLVPGAASANETRYQGIRTLVASGSMLDKGKYIIVAKVPNPESTGTPYNYYALKIIAEVVEGNKIVYSFDKTEKCDITEYITNDAGTLYMSALWQTDADSTTPTFRNCRFDKQYLAIENTDSAVFLKLADEASGAAEFSYSVSNNAFTYTVYETTENAVVSVDYYLNYDSESGFYFSTEKNTIIEMYRLSNGFTIEPVTSVSDIAANEDYLIAARHGDTYYLLGEEILETAGSTTVTATGEFSKDYTFAQMPTHWRLEDYESFRQYIWYARSADVSGNSAVLTLCEKVSGTYYLSVTDGVLDLLPQPSEWTYTQGTGTGGRLSRNSQYLAFSPASTGTGFYLSGEQYTLYLYRVIANDYEPKYNTYQGARLVTTESSVVQEGEYLIAADTGSGYIGLVVTGTGTPGALDITPYIEGTGDMDDLVADVGEHAGYKWRVRTTSAKPHFQNVAYTLYLSRGEGSLSLSSGGVEWLYDATSGRLYYNVIDQNQVATSYYLAWDGSAFVLTEGYGEPDCNYNIRLYKITYEYVYSDVVPVQQMPYEHSVYGQDRIYFILTAPLHDMDNTAAYILGAKGTENGSAVESVNISPTSTYDGTTLITTTDLSYYRWRFVPRTTIENGELVIYRAGYQFANDATGMYLAASTAQQSRTLVVAQSSNINPEYIVNGIENSSLPPTGIGLGGGNSYPTQPFYTTTGGVYSGNRFYILGNHQSYEYFLWKTPTPGVFALSLSSAKPAEYTLPYLYSSSGYTTNVTVSVLSERGDNIDPDIHYMITAVVNHDNGTSSYYAISQIYDDNGNVRLGGVNVTSQADTINNSKIYDDEGNVIEESSTDELRMVPVESDWMQISSEKGLRFYQSYYSTNAVHEYLDVSGGLPVISSIPVDSAALPVEWYYDAISKYLKYYDGDICYYLTYDTGTDSFSFTDDINSATHFYIYRFKPTYIVTQVTDAEDDSLKYGSFIVAAQSSGSHIAIGVTESDVVSKDVTGHIKPELSETEYLEILNFIWKQLYYDFSGATYNPMSSTQYLQLFSMITGGGFTTAYDVNATGGLQTGSDPMVWRIDKNPSGLWRFLNDRANGDVAAGSRYIRYSGPQSYLQFSDGYVNIGNYLGQYFDNTEFSTQGSPFVLCDTSGNVVESISQVISGTSYILRSTSNDRSFMVKCTGTVVSLVSYDPGNTTGCLFEAALGPGGIVLRNGGNYAIANSSGAIVMSTTPAGSWSIGTESRLSYTSVGTPYYYNNTYARVTANIARYTAKVYRYTYSAPYTTLTPATMPLNTNYDYVIVLYDSTNNTYHAMYSSSNNSFTPSAITVTVQGNNLRISGQLTNNYLFGAAQSGGLYRFMTRARNRYLGYDGTNITSSNSSSSTYIWSVDSNANIYYVGSNPTYTPGMLAQQSGFTAPASGGGTVYLYSLGSGVFTPVTGSISAGGIYAILVNQGGRYYLVNYDGISDIELLDMGTQLPSSLTEAGVDASARFTAASGEGGVYLYNQAAGMYLNLSNSLIILSTGKTTEWRYSYGTQKLYTVSKVSYAPQYITRSGSSVAFTTNLAETWLYEALPNGSGGYTLRRLESTMQNAGRDVVIVMYSGSQYYAVTRSGTSNIVATQINLNGTNVNANMIWKYDGSRFYYESAGVTRYLRMGSSTLTTSTDAEYFETRYTTTSFTTTTTSGQATYFGIFRVDMSSELDDVTDISTMLTGRAMLTPTISLLESSRCVLVAEVDYDGDDNIDKYYSLGMVNSSISQAIDITYQLKTALATGSTITLFDSCVWEQRGSGSVLIFDNCGFEDKYYLTGSLGNRDSMEPVVIHIPGETEPDNISDFNWRTYNFGDGSYLFGYTEESGDEDRVYYLYFDTVSLTFRLTSSLTKAKLGGGVVQIYQLGTKTVEQPNYTTIIIVTDDDTIVSYPLNLVESKTDLKKYQVIDEDGDGQPKVEGEYLIVSRSGASFYALTLDDFGRLAYIDVSPYFCGNYSRDNLGRPCLAINQRYIWQQTEDVYTYMPTRLIFRNATSTPEKPLILAGSAVFDYDFENHRLFYTSDGTMRYLNFTVAGGFEFSSEQAGEEIYLYSLGELGIDTGDGGTLNYTYYSIPLSTSLDSGVTFGNFEFIKKKIPELTHYGVGTSGMIEKSVGWKLSVNGERLTQVTSSVFFAKGYTYNPEAEKPLLDFAAEFSECSSPYAVSNGTGGEAHAGTIDYYAPAGMASFVIAEASSSKPVFVNVIVSTEFDQIRLNPEFLRYLALWRVADINIQNGTAKTLKTYEGEGAGVIMDYVYTFEQKLNTPDFAIPLPNRYASEASGASYARVEGEDYILSDPAYGEDYLIAHTFVITKPGIYYLGATYGSVAICYLSIDNTAEGETAGGTGYSEEFSIDFCYGSIDLGVTSEFTPATADLLLESLCYVGKEGWYHSNIYPIFTAGTAQNLTDRLDMNVVRVKNPDNTSSVNIKAYTRARIAPGVQYINDNTLAQREVRKVSFRVFCDGLAAGLYGKEATIYWTASKSETDNTFRIYSTYSIGGVINSYYLSADSSVPMLSTSGSYYWTCDEHGYLMSPDEKYLTYNQETFSLSPNPVNAVVLYKPDGGILVPVSSISHGGAYLLLVPVDGGYIMLKIAPEAE